jgi:hypothetical protein
VVSSNHNSVMFKAMRLEKKFGEEIQAESRPEFIVFGLGMSFFEAALGVYVFQRCV